MVTFTDLQILLIATVALFIATMTPSELHAQQTVFNVPSAEVLIPKEIYLENDWYVRSWNTDSGKTGTTYTRGIVGIGKNIEIGFDVGPFEVLGANEPFICFAAKWRPVLHEIGGRHSPGAIGFFIGDNVGIGLHGQTKGKGSNFTYGVFSLKLPDLQTRLGIGPYYATKHYFGERGTGALASIEQPIPGIKDLILAADWYSGNSGYFTPGLIYSRWNISLSLGYGLANSGRKDDLLTMELGYTFPTW